MDRTHGVWFSCALAALFVLAGGCGDSDPDEPLIDAVIAGDEAALGQLLADGVDPNMHGEVGGDTGLHLAAFKRSVPMATLLLEAGADPNIRRDDGEAPLHIAAQEGEPRMVELLIEHGADLDLENQEGMTPLAVATTNGHGKVVELLKAREAAARWGVLAPARLSEAAGIGDLSEAAMLLSDQTGPDVKDLFGLTPLITAALAHQPETATLLIESGADVNMTANGMTPLHYAASAGSLRVAKVLLAHGAAVNAQGPHGATPLALALESGMREMVVLLEECGAEASWGDRDGAPVFEAVARGNAEAVEALLADGVDPSKKVLHWVTPLHVAVTGQSPKMVRLLLEHGADPDAATTGGLSPCPACPDSISNHVAFKAGVTPLHLAVYQGNAELVRLLLEHGADINRESKNGETPLAIAVACGHQKIVDLLGARGGLEHAPPPEREFKTPQI